MTDRAVAQALLAPKTVALVGASGDPEKNTARPLRYLRKHGFKGGVYPVNPGRDEVLGEKAWPDLKAAAEAAGGAIDHAYLMIPALAVPDAIADCARAGVRVASVYADGFAELGEEGMIFQDDVVAMARDGGVRLVGPNSMGVVNVHAAMGMTTNAALEAPALVPGPFSVVSQSGTALGALLSRGQARGFGFAKLVSIGNEADLSVGEIADFLVDDEDTGAILLFLETLRRADRLADAARRAYEAGKPVIAYKIGRSEAGRQMAVSHSGAVGGPDKAADAFFRHHGIIRVDSLEALLETPFLVMGRRPAPARRVAVLTTTGGGAAMVVDRLGQAGIDFAVPPMSVVERMIGLDIRVGEAPVIDLTMAGARADVYGPVLRDLIAAGECDAVVCVVGSSAQFRPDVAVRPIIAEGKGEMPLAVFCVPEAGDSLKALAGAGIAGFRTPESCADGVRAFLDWRPPADPAAARGDDGGLARATAHFKAVEGPRLDEVRALEVFGALGIDAAAHWVMTGKAAPAGVRYPAAAKVLSGDVPHKTDAGGVVLGIADDAGLEAAASEILERVRAAHPGAEIGGVLVQEMVEGLAEVLVGYRLDAEAGPVVVLASGGTLTELVDDGVVWVAPVDAEGALAMIERVRGLAPLRGFRGLPQGDLEALAGAVAAVSRLAADPRVREAEINPLIVRPRGEGVVAVDGLIVLADG